MLHGKYKTLLLQAKVDQKLLEIQKVFTVISF